MVAFSRTKLQMFALSAVAALAVGFLIVHPMQAMSQASNVTTTPTNPVPIPPTHQSCVKLRIDQPVDPVSMTSNAINYNGGNLFKTVQVVRETFRCSTISGIGGASNGVTTFKDTTLFITNKEYYMAKPGNVEFSDVTCERNSMGDVTGCTTNGPGFNLASYTDCVERPSLFPQEMNSASVQSSMSSFPGSWLSTATSNEHVYSCNFKNISTNAVDVEATKVKTVTVFHIENENINSAGQGNVLQQDNFVTTCIRDVQTAQLDGCAVTLKPSTGL